MRGDEELSGASAADQDAVAGEVERMKLTEKKIVVFAVWKRKRLRRSQT